ncbi:MAG: hypothetical protein QGI45_15250, partial [Myxococcota bacterium]|nr:hypothetical protein [Myxococcota bacterium]
LMIGFGGDCGANAGEDLYWPENRDVRVRIDGHNFDFQEDGFIDGPFSHNGGFTIKTNVAGHLEADIKIGKKKDGYTSDLNIHLSIVNGIARVKGTAKGQKVDARVKIVKIKGKVTITFDGHKVSW